MKRLLTLGLSLGLVAAMAVPALADDDGLTWDGNANANFAMFSDRNLPTADGYAIINYVKGKDAYNVSGEVWGMRPGSYQLSVGTAGVCTDNTVLVTFATDANGYAAFKSTHTNLLQPDSAFNIARIVKLGGGCNTELTAPTTPYTNDYGDVGQLVFRDGSRYDPADSPE